MKRRTRADKGKRGGSYRIIMDLELVLVMAILLLHFKIKMHNNNKIIIKMQKYKMV